MRIEIYLFLLVLATGSALLLGTRGERWVGATVLAGNALTFALERLFGTAFSSVPFAYLGLDAGLAVLLCAVAVRHPSWTAICVSAFQINGTLGHLVKLVAPQTIPFSYAFLLKFWAWPMVLTILLGRGIPRMRGILKARDWPPVVRRSGA
jgi:hypothetical protein